MINWSGVEEKGFAGVSRALLSHYRSLNITMEEALLVMHILDYAWLGQNPFPGTKWLTEKTGKSDQTIRMYLRSLCAKDYLVQVQDKKRGNTYDWTPLMNAIKHVAKIPEEQKDLQDSEPPKSQNELKNLIDAGLDLAKDRSKGRVPVQTKPSHWKRLQAFGEKPASQYNAKDMELVLASAWKAKGWKTSPPRFTKRDLGHAKQLIEQYGSEDTANVIKKIIENWEKIKMEYTIKGYPSMPIFFGFRNSFFPLVIDGGIDDSPKWGSHFKNEEKPQDHIGW